MAALGFAEQNRFVQTYHFREYGRFQLLSLHLRIQDERKLTMTMIMMIMINTERRSKASHHLRDKTERQNSKDKLTNLKITNQSQYQKNQPTKNI